MYKDRDQTLEEKSASWLLKDASSEKLINTEYIVTIN